MDVDVGAMRVVSWLTLSHLVHSVPPLEELQVRSACCVSLLVEMFGLLLLLERGDKVGGIKASQFQLAFGHVGKREERRQGRILCFVSLAAAVLEK